MSIWKVIDDAISKTEGYLYSTVSRQAVSGGDISQAYRLTDEKRRYFVKINSANFKDRFNAESVGLKALAHESSFRIPKVISIGVFQDKSYLILEFIEMTSIGDASKFAKALGQLHAHTQTSFGFESNNFIGSSVQENNWSNNWGEFFVDNRLKPQLKALDVVLLTKLEQQKFFEKILEFLNYHQPKPSLVHGDLWQGNVGYTTDGYPVIYDPACYYADYEVDLAMLELFGTPGGEFFKQYQKTHSIQSGYSTRKEIYNLYHILNHANMFAGGYIQQAKAMLKNIAQLLN
ncbi:MAG: fructosamine kinase family protein [Kangiellaceae bacterium]